MNKKQYEKKPVTSEVCTSVNYIHILLFKAEAHWAYGMSRKTMLSKEEHADNNRLKFAFKKRFRLAHLAALELQKVGESRLDGFSQIEVEAYVSYLCAVFQMEQKKF